MRSAALPLALLILVSTVTAQQISEAQIKKGLASIKSTDTIKKVKILADDELEGRNAGYEGCWKAADWIGEQFAALELKPIGEEQSYFQTFTFNARGANRQPRGGDARGGNRRRPSRKTPAVEEPHHETPTTRNVVALLEGSHPELKDEVVILGGHYDHVGREGQWNRGSRRGNSKGRDDIWNGADDNASGTAVVIEVAEAFVASGIRPRRSVMFILFSAEEHGLFGSKWYCDHPLMPLEKTVAMLNLDMVGYGKAKRLEIGGVDHAAGGVMRTAISRAVKKVRGLDADLRSWASSGSSDHAPFISSRVPAVFFFNGLHKDYHTIADEVRLCSGRRMEKVAEVAFLSAIALAELPEKPEFVPASGETVGPGMLGVSIAGTLSEDEAKELKLKRKQGGLRVENVFMQSPAADAGVEPGDVIIALDRDNMSLGNEAICLKNALRKLDPGKSFTLRILREGKKKTLRCKMPS